MGQLRHYISIPLDNDLKLVMQTHADNNISLQILDPMGFTSPFSKNMINKKEMVRNLKEFIKLIEESK